MSVVTEEVRGTVEGGVRQVCVCRDGQTRSSEEVDAGRRGSEEARGFAGRRGEEGGEGERDGGRGRRAEGGAGTARRNAR